jgi:hypothetical protein
MHRSASLVRFCGRHVLDEIIALLGQSERQGTHLVKTAAILIKP